MNQYSLAEYVAGCVVLVLIWLAQVAIVIYSVRVLFGPVVEWSWESVSAVLTLLLMVKAVARCASGKAGE